MCEHVWIYVSEWSRPYWNYIVELWKCVKCGEVRYIEKPLK